MTSETSLGGDRQQFEPTAWTVILKARDESELGELIHRYWKPCYFFVRRKGYSVEDAKDLTQGFYVDIMERNALAAVTPSKGRFRTFLLACLEHFLSHHRDRINTLKRGGAVAVMNFEAAESFLGAANTETPERAYLRQWGLEILDRALTALEGEMGDRFQALREYILAGRPGRLREVAERLQMTEGNVKVTIHRARQRYLELIRLDVGRTLDSPEEVEDELRELLGAVSGS